MREGAALAEDQGAVSWRSSSYSTTSSEPNCCEIALTPGEIRVRDSKCPNQAVLSFAPDAWYTAMAWVSCAAPGQAEP
ncbi:DUF397 domain-containing protein [Streptomyces tuirus]|uniref:DUF397 domain-containing protein n=1 Tax=Streptomyces tuirus TaxID=68278 RepID=UPI0034458959